MKILFYSTKCNFSSEIIKQIKDSVFVDEFKFINIDSEQIPSMIKVVPTIFDENYKDLLEGKKAFEYLFDKKYFNISTNNIHLWKDKMLPKPDIIEDTLAKNNNENYNEFITNQSIASQFIANQFIASQSIASQSIANASQSIANQTIDKKKIILSKSNLLLVKRKN